MVLTGTNIHHAATLLKEGKVVAIPTETVYGLAGNALDEDAVLTIFEVKNRPHFDPLIIHVSSLEAICQYVEDIPKTLKVLAEKFMPGPLTLLLPKKDIIPDLVTSGSPMVAVRIPSHPLTKKLLVSLDFPLAAPSANPFGYISPTTAKHVADQLGDHIPYILDGGPCEVGLESTIVGMEDGRVTVYRKGGLEVESIQVWVDHEILVKTHSTSKPDAPGMLSVHYAPKKPLFILENETDWASKTGEKNVCFLRFSTPFEGFDLSKQRILSPQGDYHEAAHHLFAFMRELDVLPFDVIYAERLPEVGLGRAINDRLKRASVF
ncbi:MAG: threonylcarbamoyl-AMP synthase [Saprospiraceae bacterium]|nr:threonylcarbamoyl-AMP synthase [Saprospiraceae bacterium]